MIVGSMKDAMASVIAAGGPLLVSKRGGGHTLSDNWIDYIKAPTSSRWWRAHNASLEAGVTAAKGLFSLEPPAERLFIAGVLRRVYLLGDACQRLGQCIPTQHGILKAAIDVAGYPEHYPTVGTDRIVNVTIAEYPADLAVFLELHPEWTLTAPVRCLIGDLSLPFPYQEPGKEQP